MIIRRVLPEELPWVNEQYDKVQFQHSGFENEIIAVAEVDEEKAGLGRLVWVSEHELELGGMYVSETYRGSGIARSIVEYLKQQVQGKTLYCLPFEHLQEFYKSCGFKPVPESEVQAVPEKVREKLNWCNHTYCASTLLLVQEV